MLKKLLKILLALIVAATLAFVVFWFARPADVSFDELKASAPYSADSRFAEIDGVRIHYQERGAGTPLVLLHGYTSSTYSWKDVFAPLAQKYRVIAVDLKGFGFSAKPDGDYTRRAQGELVAHLLDYLKIEKAWLCGNSMGGETALNVALQHPEKVIGLILLDSGGAQLPGKTSLVPWYVQMPLVGRAVTALALTSDKLVREGLRKSFYDDTKVTDERVAHYYAPLHTRGGQLAATRARAQVGLYPVENDLRQIHAPTLLIWGAQDEVIPLEAGRKMNALIKDSKLTVYENCGHLPQEEMPERIAEDVTTFISAGQLKTQSGKKIAVPEN